MYVCVCVCIHMCVYIYIYICPKEKLIPKESGPKPWTLPSQSPQLGPHYATV